MVDVFQERRTLTDGDYSWQPFIPTSGFYTPSACGGVVYWSEAGYFVSEGNRLVVCYPTVTDFARDRGLSTLRLRLVAVK